MIFQGCYFKDSEIIQAYHQKNKDFHVDLADSKGLIFHDTTKEERDAFVRLLDSRMCKEPEE